MRYRAGRKPCASTPTSLRTHPPPKIYTKPYPPNLVQYVVMNDANTSAFLARAFTENRERLLALAGRNLKPVLMKRLSPEDVLSATYEACAKRLAYFATHTDVPVYFKLRTLLFQTLADLERKNLGAGARDAYREVSVADAPQDETAAGGLNWGQFAADVTSPASRVDRDERHKFLRAALDALSAADRQILVLRHFDGLGNGEAVAVLGIEPKAASIRHVRALERLQRKLTEVSCFRKGPRGL